MLEPQNLAVGIAEHLPFLNRFVGRLTRGNEMAEDIVQQTVLKALIHADQFRFEATVRTWLASIAINETRQVYRSAWRTRTVPLVTEALDRRTHRVRELSSHAYESKECDGLVRDAVSRLPAAYRSVVELCDLQCLPANEAAQLLGLTVPAVKTRRHRARQKLQRLVRKMKPSAQVKAA